MRVQHDTICETRYCTVAPYARVDLRAALCGVVNGQRCVKGTIRRNDRENTNANFFDSQGKQRCNSCGRREDEHAVAFAGTADSYKFRSRSMTPMTKEHNGQMRRPTPLAFFSICALVDFVFGWIKWHSVLSGVGAVL
jgi:hypothetical protein